MSTNTAQNEEERPSCIGRNLPTFYYLCPFCRKFQAFKQGMYGPKYVWILFSGRNQDNWWKVQSPLVDCTPEQVRKGLSNNIGTGELKISPTSGPTKFGKVLYFNTEK